MVKFVWPCFLSITKFSCWSKFHANIIITGSRVMAISVYKGLTRNSKIGNIPVWLVPSIWRLEPVSNSKFCTSMSNKMLLSAAKFHGYSFFHFLVIKRKSTLWGGGEGWGWRNYPYPLPHPILWLGYRLWTEMTSLNYLMYHILDILYQTFKIIIYLKKNG